jgi:hypothetical protein
MTFFALNANTTKTYLTLPELRDRDDIPLLLEDKKLVLNWFGWNLPHMQLTDWLLVEVALRLHGSA